eukprot:2890295-Karenia_brevis.AAC.1
MKEQLRKRIPNFDDYDVVYGSFFKGPRSNRTITKNGFVEFASEDVCSIVFQVLKGANVREFSANGGNIKIRAALTQINRKRNWALRRAEDLLKSSPLIQGNEVKIDFATRVVKVGNTNAFVQSKFEVTGAFAEAYPPPVMEMCGIRVRIMDGVVDVDLDLLSHKARE